MSHYIERHGEHVTEQQLEARCTKHIDPITGERQDGEKSEDHYCGRHATKFNSRRSVITARDTILNSQEYQTRSTDETTKQTGFMKITIPLETIFPSGYLSHVYGRTLVGTAKTPGATSVETDFKEGGTVKAMFALDSKGNWTMITMYPDPK
jgi:hypothetical protein